MKSDKQTVITATENSVKLVETKLEALDKLTNDEKALTESIAALQNDEANLLAGDQEEGAKLKALLKLRATTDIKKADRKKLEIEKETTFNELVHIALRSHGWLNAIDDILRAHRIESVTQKLSEIFPEKWFKQLQIHAKEATSVQELQRDRAHFPPNRPDLSLHYARQTKLVWDKLRSELEKEESEIEFPIPADWLQPVALVRRELAKDTQFVVSRS